MIHAILLCCQNNRLQPIIIQMPRITVLLPVHNAMPWLAPAVESLMRQTCKDFTVLAVNDGSADDSGAYLDNIHDPRFKIIHQKNIGLAATLNRMIELVDTEYIARMDADDISLPDRLFKQSEFLDSHTEVAVVGTRGGYIRGRDRAAAIGLGSFKRTLSYAPPMAHPPYWNPLVDDGILIHSTVMMRTEHLKKVNGYPDMVPGQDLALWHRMAHAGMRLANMDEMLLLSRVARSGISSSNLTRQYHAWCYTSYHSQCLIRGENPMPLAEYAKTHPLPPNQLEFLEAKAALRNSMADILSGKWLIGTAGFVLAFIRCPSLVLSKISGRLRRA